MKKHNKRGDSRVSESKIANSGLTRQYTELNRAVGRDHFQSVGTSPAWKALRLIVERDPAKTYANSFNTMGWVPSGPTNIQLMVPCNWKVISLPVPVLQHRGPGSPRSIISVKHWSKKRALNASAFYPFLLPRWPSSISPMFSSDLAFFHCLTLHWPVSSWALAFLVFSQEM